MFTAEMPSQSLLWTFVLFTSLVSCQISSSFPVFGTKRYGHSVGVPTHRIPPWGPLPLQPYPLAPPSTPNHFLAPSYYPDYAYAPDYDTDYFYSPDPVFNAYPHIPPMAVYPPIGANDNVKYAMYHSMLPYYYDARRSGYGYYGYDDNSDSVDDVQEKMIQEEEREERTDALPIGQETWFENESALEPQQQLGQDSLADVNAAFLQNLIISQMYNDAQNRESSMRQQQDNSDGWIYGDPRSEGYYSDSDDEDEDVRELKSLAKKSNTDESDRLPVMPMRRSDKNFYGNDDDYNVGIPVFYPPPEYNYKKRSLEFGTVVESPMSKENTDEWVAMNDVPISFTDRKGNRFLDNQAQGSVDYVNDLVGTNAENVLSGETTTTTAATTTTGVPTTAATTLPTTEAPDFDPRRGQKEVPLLRPAQIPHRPVFEDDFDVLLQTRMERPRPKPTVFDTIRQLLNMEEGLRHGDGSMRQQPQKRFVANEQSLVEQLGGLKKNAA